MEDLKIANKYLKNIIKSNLGKIAIRRLKITAIAGSSLYSNLFYKAGFYFRVFVYFEGDNPKASILLYNYYFDHSWLKDKSVTSVSSIINNKFKYNKYNYRYLKNEDCFKLSDRVTTIPYSKELFFKFYSAVETIQKDLNFGKTLYYGDGYGQDRLEYLFSKDGIKIKQGNFQIDLEDLRSYSLKYLIMRVNHIRNLGLEDISIFELNKNTLIE